MDAKIGGEWQISQNLSVVASRERSEFLVKDGVPRQGGGTEAS